MVLNGECLVNEAVLTGESMPITKYSYKKKKKIHDRCMIYSGSTCLQVKHHPEGLVINTAWNTYKGDLVGKLVEQKVSTFSFDQQTWNFIFILTGFFFGLSIFLLIFNYNVNYEKITFKNQVQMFIEIMTEAMPPGLFFAMLVG